MCRSKIETSGFDKSTSFKEVPFIFTNRPQAKDRVERANKRYMLIYEFFIWNSYYRYSF